MRLFGFGTKLFQFVIWRARWLLLLIRQRVLEEGVLNLLSLTRRPPRPGALLIGYIEAELGLGQSLRGLATSLDAADVPFGIYPFHFNVSKKKSGPWHPEWYDRSHRYRASIIEVSADQFPFAKGLISRSYLAGSYVILRVFWELPRAPESWRGNLADVDELWVPNAYVADAFRHIFAGPITVIPVCVDIGDLNPGPVEVPYDADSFTLLFSFDYNSSPERKNPLGVVHAFQLAFPAAEKNARLVIKAHGEASLHADTFAAIADASAADPRIVVIDKTMSRAELLALLRSADCYVSLHRSEGFGLGMAEAMAMAKPVIGTNFSGNTQFLSEETGFPVRFRLVDVPAGAYPFHEGMVWAEPDIAHAAELMREVALERSSAAERGLNGKALISSTFSPDAVGAACRRRLDALGLLQDAGEAQPLPAKGCGERYR